MISIITPNGILGGFNSVVTYEDHYDAGGTLYYFDVIGSPHSLGNWEPLGMTSQELFDLKTKIWDDIKAYRDNRVQNGGYMAGGHWFHSDTFSRTQQMGLVMMGSNMPAGIPWKTLDNGVVTMTPTLAGQIFTAAAMSDITVFAAAESHRAAMWALDNPASYNYVGGYWPAIYGESSS